MVSLLSKLGDFPLGDRFAIANQRHQATKKATPQQRSFLMTSIPNIGACTSIGRYSSY